MNNTKTKSRLCHLLSFCIALTLFQACDVDDLVGLNYDRIEHLGSYFGDPNQSTVIIHVQGGPSIQLEDQNLIDLIQPINTNGIIVANFKQFQIQEPRAVNTKEISLDEALKFSLNSTDSLITVIRHFKSQDKAVYVLGTGYGGYLVQEVLSRYGTDEADQFLVMGSRLNIHPEFVAQWDIGNDSQYDYGATPAGVIFSEQDNRLQRNMNRIMSSLAKHNYVTKLENERLENVTYVFLNQDERVGPVSAEELDFLNSQGANIISGMGNHSDGIRATIKESIELSFGIE